jgi:hypothetical protein
VSLIFSSAIEAVLCTKDNILTWPPEPTVALVQTCEKASAMVMQGSHIYTSILYGGFVRGVYVRIRLEYTAVQTCEKSSAMFMPKLLLVVTTPMCW